MLPSINFSDSDEMEPTAPQNGDFSHLAAENEELRKRINQLEQMLLAPPHSPDTSSHASTEDRPRGPMRSRTSQDVDSTGSSEDLPSLNSSEPFDPRCRNLTGPLYKSNRGHQVLTRQRSDGSDGVKRGVSDTSYRDARKQPGVRGGIPGRQTRTITIKKTASTTRANKPPISPNRAVNRTVSSTTNASTTPTNRTKPQPTTPRGLTRLGSSDTRARRTPSTEPESPNSRTPRKVGTLPGPLRPKTPRATTTPKRPVHTPLSGTTPNSAKTPPVRSLEVQKRLARGTSYDDHRKPAPRVNAGVSTTQKIKLNQSKTRVRSLRERKESRRPSLKGPKRSELDAIRKRNVERRKEQAAKQQAAREKAKNPWERKPLVANRRHSTRPEATSPLSKPNGTIHHGSALDRRPSIPSTRGKAITPRINNSKRPPPPPPPDDDEVDHPRSLGSGAQAAAAALADFQHDESLHEQGDVLESERRLKELQEEEENERRERERWEREQAERQKLEKERLERLEKARHERERLEKQRLEQERLEQERLEQERLEQERLEQERLEQERLERERLEQERLEQERLEQERRERERLEQERRERERLEQERRERERLEQERRERERLEQERRERERLERERLERKRLEKERLEKERQEQERLEREQIERDRLERERIEQERVEKERIERESLIRGFDGHGDLSPIEDSNPGIPLLGDIPSGNNSRTRVGETGADVMSDDSSTHEDDKALVIAPVPVHDDTEFREGYQDGNGHYDNGHHDNGDQDQGYYDDDYTVSRRTDDHDDYNKDQHNVDDRFQDYHESSSKPVLSETGHGVIERFDSLCLDDLEDHGTLGRGCFGHVKLVRHRGNGKMYALKVLNKRHQIEQQQVQHAINENSILRMMNHPFIVKSHGSFQDDENLYILMERVVGTEFYDLLQEVRKFSPDSTRFFAAQIVLILEHLHNTHNVLYRDLKPENILLDAEGYLKLTDFGFAKVEPARTHTFCGTPCYIAPEIIYQTGYTKAVDWWALGVMIYEMLSGEPPLDNDDLLQLYDDILHTSPRYDHRIFPIEAQDLIDRFLTKEPEDRFGISGRGVADVKRHVFFKGIDWDAIANRHIQSPFGNIDFLRNGLEPYDDEESEEEHEPLSRDEQLQFRDF